MHRRVTSHPLSFPYKFRSTGVANVFPPIVRPLVFNGLTNVEDYEKMKRLQQISNMESAGIDSKFYKDFWSRQEGKRRPNRPQTLIGVDGETELDTTDDYFDTPINSTINTSSAGITNVSPLGTVNLQLNAIRGAKARETRRHALIQQYKNRRDMQKTIIQLLSEQAERGGIPLVEYKVAPEEVKQKWQSYWNSLPQYMREELMYSLSASNKPLSPDETLPLAISEVRKVHEMVQPYGMKRPPVPFEEAQERENRAAEERKSAYIETAKEHNVADPKKAADLANPDTAAPLNPEGQAQVNMVDGNLEGVHAVVTAEPLNVQPSAPPIPPPAYPESNIHTAIPMPPPPPPPPPVPPTVATSGQKIGVEPVSTNSIADAVAAAAAAREQRAKEKPPEIPKKPTGNPLMVALSEKIAKRRKLSEPEEPLPQGDNNGDDDAEWELAPSYSSAGDILRSGKFDIARVIDPQTLAPSVDRLHLYIPQFLEALSPTEKLTYRLPPPGTNAYDSLIKDMINIIAANLVSTNLDVRYKHDQVYDLYGRRVLANTPVSFPLVTESIDDALLDKLIQTTASFNLNHISKFVSSTYPKMDPAQQLRYANYLWSALTHLKTTNAGFSEKVKSIAAKHKSIATQRKIAKDLGTNTTPLTPRTHKAPNRFEDSEYSSAKGEFGGGIDFYDPYLYSNILSGFGYY